MPTIPTRFPWTRLALVALLATAAPAALALEAWRAGRRHRAAAERALDHYAGSAALAFRERLITRLYFPVNAIFAPALREDAGPGDTLPHPAALRRAAAALPRCADCGAALRPTWAFRLRLADSALTVDGPPLPAESRAALIARLPPMARIRALEPWYTSMIDTAGPEPEVVYLALRRGPSGAPEAAYGFAVSLEEVGRTVLRPLLERVGLVPLALPTSIPNDSVLSVSILRPGGAPALELSPRRHPPVYAASIPASRFLGNWTLHLALDPVTAPPILIGGLPPSRGLPLALLVLVTGALVGVTLLAARRAFELARLRADFVASVSHELRTPLAQIQLFGESLALGRMRSRGDVRDAGRVVVGEARRLLHMVENAILFNRGGRPAAAPVVVLPLAPLVRETVESFEPLAAASAARLRTVRLDEVTAPVDRGALRQVLLNLLDNAAKYGPRGGTISVGLARRDGRARIWVEDEGPGIPAADRDRVWEPFLRLPRDLESHAAGSGIGLALVRELVGLHRGSAWIEPAPGGGACVVVELPNAGGAPEPTVRTEEPCGY